MLNDTVLMSKIVKDNQTLSYTIHERSIVFRMEGGTGQVPFGVVELGGGLLEWKVAPHLPTVAIRSASMGLQVDIREVDLLLFQLEQSLFQK